MFGDVKNDIKDYKLYRTMILLTVTITTTKIMFTLTATTVTI